MIVGDIEEKAVTEEDEVGLKESDLGAVNEGPASAVLRRDVQRQGQVVCRFTYEEEEDM